MPPQQAEGAQLTHFDRVGLELGRQPRLEAEAKQRARVRRDAEAAVVVGGAPERLGAEDVRRQHEQVALPVGDDDSELAAQPLREVLAVRAVHGQQRLTIGRQALREISIVVDLAVEERNDARPLVHKWLRRELARQPEQVVNKMHAVPLDVASVVWSTEPQVVVGELEFRLRHVSVRDEEGATARCSGHARQETAHRARALGCSKNAPSQRAHRRTRGPNAGRNATHLRTSFDLPNPCLS